jgi:hypothetical protein
MAALIPRRQRYVLGKFAVIDRYLLSLIAPLLLLASLPRLGAGQIQSRHHKTKHAE